VQKKRHGRELEGRTWDEMPELVSLASRNSKADPAISIARPVC
jgi:hypothetical protein